MDGVRRYGSMLMKSISTDDAAWAGLCSRLDRRTVPGDHYSMLRPPHLAVLAAAVRAALPVAARTEG